MCVIVGHISLLAFEIARIRNKKRIVTNTSALNNLWFKF